MWVNKKEKYGGQLNMQETKSGKCDDMISRETVEDIRKALIVWADHFMSTETINNTFNRFLEKVEPEAEPEPNTGHWRRVSTNEYACGHCDHCFSIDLEDNSIEEYMHCPNCGKRMFEPQIENGKGGMRN